MYIDGHPNCCGIFILSGFYDPKHKTQVPNIEQCPNKDYGGYYRKQFKLSEKTHEEAFDSIMEAYAPYFKRSSESTKTLEAVLTDSQLTNWDGFWAKKLKENGFHPTLRFRNTSGSVCNVFHKYADGGIVEGPVPNWEV